MSIPHINEMVVLSSCFKTGVDSRSFLLNHKFPVKRETAGICSISQQVFQLGRYGGAGQETVFDDKDTIAIKTLYVQSGFLQNLQSINTMLVLLIMAYKTNG